MNGKLTHDDHRSVVALHASTSCFHFGSFANASDFGNTHTHLYQYVLICSNMFYRSINAISQYVECAIRIKEFSCCSYMTIGPFTKHQNLKSFNNHSTDCWPIEKESSFLINTTMMSHSISTIIGNRIYQYLIIMSNLRLSKPIN